MANKPHHGMRGLMSPIRPLNAGAHMPERHPSGGDRKAKQTHTARNGKQTGHLKTSGTSDTRRRSGAEGNGKGTVAHGQKGASLASHKGTAGRGGAGSTNQMHSNRLSESISHEAFEKLGA